MPVPIDAVTFAELVKAIEASRMPKNQGKAIVRVQKPKRLKHLPAKIRVLPGMMGHVMGYEEFTQSYITWVWGTELESYLRNRVVPIIPKELIGG